MTILILQSLLLLLVAFIVGCLLGCVFRRFLSKEAAAERGVPAPPLSGARPAVPAPRPSPEPVAEPTVEPASEPSIAVPEPYVFTADRSDQAVTLSGQVPSAAERDGVFGVARARFEGLVVDDRLSVGGDAPKRVDWPAAISFALDQLTGLESGRVRLQDDVLSLSGTARDQTTGEGIGAAMQGELPAGLALGTFDLKGREPVGDEQPARDEPMPDTAAPAAPAAGDADAAEPAMAPVDVDAPAGLSGQQPAGTAAPRGGRADDLKRIKGIGKVNERKLNALGVWHLDQIAAWSDQEIAWVDGYLAFKGRIEREDWVGQAKALAEGGDGNPES